MPELRKLGPNDISKAMFIRELSAARERAGSTMKLALAMKQHPRRITMWLAGNGPSYTNMQRLYFEVRKI